MRLSQQIKESIWANKRCKKHLNQLEKLNAGQLKGEKKTMLLLLIGTGTDFFQVLFFFFLFFFPNPNFLFTQTNWAWIYWVRQLLCNCRHGKYLSLAIQYVRFFHLLGLCTEVDILEDQFQGRVWTRWLPEVHSNRSFYGCKIILVLLLAGY